MPSSGARAGADLAAAREEEAAAALSELYAEKQQKEAIRATFARKMADGEPVPEWAVSWQGALDKLDARLREIEELLLSVRA